MASKSLTCSVCTEPMWNSSTSRPQGEATCRPCRSTPEWQAARRERNKLAQRKRRHGDDAPAERSVNCAVCGELFTCSLMATNRIKCDVHKHWRIRPCSRCGTDHYSQNKAGSRSYCSNDCKEIATEDRRLPPSTKLKWRQCLKCSKWMCRPRARKYCSFNCWHSMTYKIRSGSCHLCGIAIAKSRQYCVDCSERRKAETRKASQRRRRQKYGNSFRARARQHGVRYERVDRTKVYERDGWKCGICQRKVNRRLKAPHPMSASLDHIVPMSLGGDHLYVNCQLAHHRCNSLKSSSGSGDQLALIG